MLAEGRQVLNKYVTPLKLPVELPATTSPITQNYSRMSTMKRVVWDQLDEQTQLTGDPS